MLLEETASPGITAADNDTSIRLVASSCLAGNQSPDMHHLHRNHEQNSNSSHENDASFSSVISSTSNTKEIVNSPMDRFPLCQLDTNSSSTPGAATPLSYLSKASSGRAMDVDYEYTNRYIVSLNYDEDDHEVELEENGINNEDLMHEEENGHSYINDCSTIGQSTVTSANRKLDYDSVVYSGYAGSISAAPSYLSEGFSIDNEGIQMNISPSRHARVTNNRLVTSSRRREHEREDYNTNCTQTDCSVSVSFSEQMKKFRVKRRRIRAESQKLHKEGILCEFRSFLFRNRRNPQNQDVNPEMQENLDTDVIGEGLEGALEGNLEFRTATCMPVFDGHMSQDFTPTKLHGDVPWIVFHNDGDEDLSTINGGSRCGAFVENKDVESAWDHLHNAAGEDEKENGLGMYGNTRNRMEMIYIVLIAASVTTLSAVVAVIVVYL